MSGARHLTVSDADYPARLLALPHPPAQITLAGGLIPARTVAIVGTRRPTSAAETFAHDLARSVAQRQGVVVSGGAVGIDSAAHSGAIEGGGATWLVAGTGHGAVQPRRHDSLFDRIVSASGAVLWPFPEGAVGHPSRFLQRNGVLVALSDVVVIVQAGVPSGALNAAAWARRLGRPRWVVCPAPWDSFDGAFDGCHVERRRGARTLTSVDLFFETLDLPASAPPRLSRPARSRTEASILAAVHPTPTHVDEICSGSGLPPHAVVSALLTLVLENVLVEGPEGFYRRSHSP
jgi:DNA processing protein